VVADARLGAGAIRPVNMIDASGQRAGPPPLTLTALFV
jgi:hypothetical protein